MNKEKLFDLSNVSKIEIKEEEIPLYSEFLDNFVQDISILEGLEIDGYTASEYYTKRFRKDIPGESLTIDEVFMNTRSKKYSYFEILESVDQE